jgi:hypothetical protein
MIKRLVEECNKNKDEHESVSGDKYKYETEIKVMFKETKRHNDNIGTLKKVLYLKIISIGNRSLKKII